MNDEFDLPSVNFISCVKWIRRGVAESHPTKVQLTKQELDDVIRKTRSNLRVGDNEEDSGTENEPPAEENDEFRMETYDDEGENQTLGLDTIGCVDNEDGYNPEDVDEDSEAEDEIIKPTDNLIVVGHAEEDACILEVYVYNEDEGSMYVHHDMILPSIPLTAEWLNYGPENVNVAGNLCAVGFMDPIIQVWDLDLVNAIEPAYKLGRKRSIKKGREAVGHRDAVLDLSWNINLPHILASGSVDQTVLLWDLERKTPSCELKKFRDKVQSLEWHPVEGHTLLTGSADKKCRVWDCRAAAQYRTWKFEGEIERTFWNFQDPNLFVACDNTGFIHYVDIRNNSPRWSIKAYENGVAGMHLSVTVPGLLVSVSESGVLKIWDTHFTETQPALIAEKILKVGHANCLDVAAESPFSVAVGGDNKSHNFIVQSLLDMEAVKNTFGSRERRALPSIEGAPQAGPSTIHAPEKRPRSAERATKIKKKSKNFPNHP